MVSQLLFGEHFEVFEKQSGWYKIRMAYDQYEGWIPESQFLPVNFDEYNKLGKEQYCVSFDLVQILLLDDQLFRWYWDRHCLISRTGHAGWALLFTSLKDQ
jgi:hypothetical protein